jgi:hypothetical protein
MHSQGVSNPGRGAVRTPEKAFLIPQEEGKYHHPLALTLPRADREIHSDAPYWKGKRLLIAAADGSVSRG